MAVRAILIASISAISLSAKVDEGHVYQLPTNRKSNNQEYNFELNAFMEAAFKYTPAYGSTCQYVLQPMFHGAVEKGR